MLVDNGSGLVSGVQLVCAAPDTGYIGLGRTDLGFLC